MPKAPQPEVESVAWAAHELAISENFAYQLAREGKLPGAIRVGAKWRVSVVRFRAAVHGGPLPDAGAAS
jgi:hypothetical protein